MLGLCCTMRRYTCCALVAPSWAFVAQPTACDAGVSGNCVLRAVEAEARCLSTVVACVGRVAVRCVMGEEVGVFPWVVAAKHVFTSHCQTLTHTTR